MCVVSLSLSGFLMPFGGADEFEDPRTLMTNQ